METGPVAFRKGSQRSYETFRSYRQRGKPGYPNSKELPRQRTRRFCVYDAIGRIVRIVADEHEELGVHEIPFDLSPLPSGQYFFHIHANGISAVTGSWMEK